MNDSFVSKQRVKNSVLIAGRDIDDDGDYSGGGGGSGDDDDDDDDDGNNNNNNTYIQYIRIYKCKNL